VLLNNQANISITKIRINGVRGVQLSTDETGYLPDFFRVYSSSHTKANVLSFADVEVMYDIMYRPQESFTVCLPERDIVPTVAVTGVYQGRGGQGPSSV
jgi:hypothetical protein